MRRRTSGNQNLKGRFFRVRVEGSQSDIGLLYSREPLKFISGPLLYLMYFSNLINGLENPCLMFAGDGKVLGIANSEVIQKGLDMVHRWSVRWGLLSYLDKFRWLMGGEANPARNMGLPGYQVAVEETHRARFLGMLVNADFKHSLQYQKSAEQACYA